MNAPARNQFSSLVKIGVLAFAIAGIAGCQPPELSAIGPGASLLDPATLLTAVRIVNSGDAAAGNVQITGITLEGGTLTTPSSLPLELGTIGAGETAILNADFSGQFTPQSSLALTMIGTYVANGTTSSFEMTVQVEIPQEGPGEAQLNSAMVDANRVTDAPFPPQPRGTRLEEVNGPRWTVPTAPFVPGTPTPTETGFKEPPPQAPPAIVFTANNSLGLTSGTANGTASSVAEPSGASNGGNVVFATANWVAAFSTNGGGAFTQLNPTTIFPADAVGYCCDQIVQYVPSIDRFIWLLQGNGYRLASARPADIVSSGGTAWTYWNLTPQVFGQPVGTGLDYPDMSVGNNFLYISWDAGFGCPTGCRAGFQVVRIPLNEIQASGTINIGFTDPPDSPMAWGSHLMQNTLNEVFWAGHNNNSNMRVFSMAEGSNSYFWRDVGISSWANNALSSMTPDGVNWLTGSGGFPGNAIIGSTRVSNQLWFAWNAGTNDNFQQPHVEMVTLDRNDNFKVLQQVQIWNNSYAFAYPALATNACTQEVGLSLEFGGPANFENHVVGFWGDFLVYITTGSNVGTTRFGDYVTIRQHPSTTENPGNLFTAFGYGLTSGTAPGAGLLTDVRYVVFGRPAGNCDR